MKIGHRAWLFTVAVTVAAPLFAQEDITPATPMSAYDVVFDSRSTSSAGSMPIGNGDVGINVWVEPGGRIQCYISKTDAWDARGNLLKLGRLSLQIDSRALLPGQKFEQRLDLANGQVVMACGSQDGDNVTIRFWVDANRPVVRIEIASSNAVSSRLTYHNWRTTDEHLHGAADEPSIVFFHRNSSSVYTADAAKLNLADDLGNWPDPLLHRTFGGFIAGDDVVKLHATGLRSRQPAVSHAYEATILTTACASPEAFIEKLSAAAAGVAAVPRSQAFVEHVRWWTSFWRRSWIHVTGGDVEKSFRVSQAYHLQRFMLACAGRGDAIKFNGSIFTVDMREEVRNQGQVDADYRRWGGQYWFQNTRWAYWPMLAAGDFEMMTPFFDLYGDIDLFAKITRARFSQAGAIFDETMPFWGLTGTVNDGLDRAKRGYKTRHWNGNLELLAMLLDYHAYTGDEAFPARIVAQLDAVLAFYAAYYDVEGQGRLVMDPSQALETYWDTVNPAQDVAGWRDVLARALALPAKALGDERKVHYERFLAMTPPLPVGEEGGKRFIKVAEVVRGESSNSENPELYPVFPFRLVGVGRGDTAMGRETFNRRRFRNAHCWRSDDAQAACLGMAAASWELLWRRFGWGETNSQCRFPAFWGPTNDWVPDQDHGGVGMTALQNMLVQPGGDDGAVFVFPAWQAGYDVEFKLHVPGRRVIIGKVKDGKIVEAKAIPPLPEGKLVVFDLQ